MARASRHHNRWSSAALVAVVIVGTVLATTSASAAEPAHRAKSAVPANDWIHEQVDFIRSKQLASGAILSTGTRISPYFGNIGAFGLVKADTAESRAAALSWMKWYFAHLNLAATNVPANSVFDYIYDPAAKTETPTGDFDSVDSYASTALNLAYQAYMSGDVGLRDFVKANIGTYEAIAKILTEGAPTGVRIPSTSVDGDLTIAKPSYPIAYTMDNVEVFSGLADFARLEKLLGRTSQAKYYRSWAHTTRNAILAKLWNPANSNWDWAYGNASNTNVFYAQGTAQLWPIIFGVVEPTDPKAISGWAQFSASYPKWYAGETPDSYPWVSIARAAQIMGEADHADSFLANVHSRYAPGFTQPTTCGSAVCGQWYDAEAGWFILATAERNLHR